jgi:hypothetical protein
MAAKHLDSACLHKEVQQPTCRCRATFEFIPEPIMILVESAACGDNAPDLGRMPLSHMGSER